MSRKKEKGEAQLYLERIAKLDATIQNKLVEKASWMDIALGVTASAPSVLVEGKKGMELHNMERVQSSGSQQKMSDAVSRCVDIEREIDSLVDRLIDTKQEIIKTIEQLNAAEYDVLHKRYVQGMTPDEIALKKGKSKSWVDTKHGRALQSVQKILDSRKTRE